MEVPHITIVDYSIRVFWFSKVDLTLKYNFDQCKKYNSTCTTAFTFLIILEGSASPSKSSTIPYILNLTRGKSH